MACTAKLNNHYNKVDYNDCENNNNIITHHIEYSEFKCNYFDRYIKFDLDNKTDDEHKLCRKFYGLYLTTTDKDLDIDNFIKYLLDIWLNVYSNADKIK